MVWGVWGEKLFKTRLVGPGVHCEDRIFLKSGWNLLPLFTAVSYQFTWLRVQLGTLHLFFHSCFYRLTESSISTCEVLGGVAGNSWVDSFVCFWTHMKAQCKHQLCDFWQSGTLGLWEICWLRCLSCPSLISISIAVLELGSWSVLHSLSP